MNKKEFSLSKITNKNDKTSKMKKEEYNERMKKQQEFAKVIFNIFLY